MTLRQADTNLHWQALGISRSEREAVQHHKALIVWFTGLSGSGKSTLASAVEQALHAAGHRTIILDGDNIRHGLCSDLGFSAADRAENLRRVAEVGKLFIEAGVVVLAAFVSPYSAERNKVRALFRNEDFVEVYCCCSLDTCEKRDVKGLYGKARRGEIASFTGVSDHYEPPENPDLSVDTENDSIQACVDTIVRRIKTAAEK